ncbi:DNA topoisomerase type IB small subunit [Trypanosoma grayi]|uniref:DNA topoisomerase type IB small subunit n=1 Tax=Trypanosoma grayi TaxID=71804 RepID=UPI0004F48CB1|nr:DNA topoisomerase type IB small subunit [Trypanosoma grayi]KEG13422.1 DNA topoisomerase type IB small subunit [Trypanosoma grayi]
MAEVTPQGVQSAVGAPTPPVSHPPVKIPMKVPYVLPKAPVTQPVSKKIPAPKHRVNHNDEDDEDAVILGVAAPAKRPREDSQRKRRSAVSDDSSSSYTDSDDDNNNSSSDSDSSSSSSSRGGNSSSSVSSSGSNESSEKGSGDELTLFQIAKAKGLVNEHTTKNLEEEEEEELAPVGPPPRPPVVRSFPHDIDAALRRYDERLNREENVIRIKDDNKAVSLGTSKINYIDPRIVCSWAKEHNVPIGKIFSTTIQKKFPWAMGAENFSF